MTISFSLFLSKDSHYEYERGCPQVSDFFLRNTFVVKESEEKKDQATSVSSRNSYQSVLISLVPDTLFFISINGSVLEFLRFV